MNPFQNRMCALEAQVVQEELPRMFDNDECNLQNLLQCVWYRPLVVLHHLHSSSKYNVYSKLYWCKSAQPINHRKHLINRKLIK